MRALPLPLSLTLNILLACGCDAASEATASATGAPEPAMNDEPSPVAKSTEPSVTESALVLYPELASYVASILPDIQTISEDRRRPLDELASFIDSRLAAGESAELTFICTHNSRRSHISQLWAATAAAYYGVRGVETYSGGTEATAFNPRAVAAMRRAGFHIEDGKGDNPHYRVTFSAEAPVLECFSKKYDDDFNPKDSFAAIMTCSEADKHCPFVFGAASRIAVPYVDPKESDGTPQEASTYDARVRQIAAEMFYVFSRVKA